MKTLLSLGLLSLLTSLMATPLIRNLFRAIGIVDQPDAVRKLHAGPIPRVGGIAIVLAYGLSFAVLLFTHADDAKLVGEGLPLIYKLLPGAALVFVTGLIDDIFGLRPYQKLLGQFAASFLVYAAGLRITTVAVMSPHLWPSAAWWSCPVTVLWLVGCMNAFNLIDGLDGLAAGLSLVSTATVALVALSQNNTALAFATVPLAGALLGFLRYNVSPATIFLGDCGSLLVGFLLGCFAIIWSEKSATLLGITAPLVALCVPLLDTALSVGRRFLRSQPIFAGDRGHIHHRLLDLGLSTRAVTFTLGCMASLAAVVAIEVANQRHELLLLAMFLICIWIGIQQLNYAEFGVAGRMLLDSSFQNMLKARISLKALESSLASAETTDQCWSVLRTHSQEFGFLEISARLGDRTYRDGEAGGVLRAWKLEIPLSASDCVWLTRARHPKLPDDVSLSFADVIRRVLEPKLRSLRGVESRGIGLTKRPLLQTEY